MIQNLQKIGGLAALAMAAAFVIAFVVFLGVLMPAGYFDDGIMAADKVEIIADNSTLVTIGYLIPYVLWGFLLMALVLTLYDRLKTRTPVLAQLSTALGFTWAVIIVSSGLVAVHGIRTVAELYAVDPVLAATVWVSVETVFNGLGGEAGEIIGGTWLLLTGWAGLRSVRLPKRLSYLALVLGAVGVVTVVPLLQPVLAIFGIGLIVWFIWTGVYLLRHGNEKAV